MSQINKIDILGLLVFMPLVLIGGCSAENTESTFDPNERGHSSGWLPAGHVSAYDASPVSCTECHGGDLHGGVSGVACTDCHLGGNDAVHPQEWEALGYARHAGYVTSNGNVSCSIASCHGTTLQGVAQSGPSCTSCHLGGIGAVHPEDWGIYTYAIHSSYVAANSTLSCENAACHGADLLGVAESGPSCTICHMGGVYSIHPESWAGDAIYDMHGPYVASNGTNSCRNNTCHGSSLEGVLASGPSCYICHR